MFRLSVQLLNYFTRLKKSYKIYKPQKVYVEGVQEMENFTSLPNYITEFTTAPLFFMPSFQTYRSENSAQLHTKVNQMIQSASHLQRLVFGSTMEEYPKNLTSLDVRAHKEINFPPKLRDLKLDLVGNVPNAPELQELLKSLSTLQSLTSLTVVGDDVFLPLLSTNLKSLQLEGHSTNDINLTLQHLPQLTRLSILKGKDSFSRGRSPSKQIRVLPSSLKILELPIESISENNSLPLPDGLTTFRVVVGGIGGLMQFSPMENKKVKYSQQFPASLTDLEFRLPNSPPLTLPPFVTKLYVDIPNFDQEIRELNCLQRLTIVSAKFNQPLDGLPSNLISLLFFSSIIL